MEIAHQETLMLLAILQKIFKNNENKVPQVYVYINSEDRANCFCLQLFKNTPLLNHNVFDLIPVLIYQIQSFK